MTIASTTNKASYNGNGSTDEFAVPFYFLANADLVVTHVSTAGVESTLAITTDYTVTGAGDPAGGTVTLLTAPATGEKVVIKRSPAQVQETAYVENAAFPAKSHEQALDLLTMICQDLDEKIGRAVLVDISSGTDPADLLDEIASDVASASASAATATTQAGLATTAKNAAVVAQGLAEDARDAAVAARDAIPAAADILVADDIGVSVQAYDADTCISDAVKSYTAQHYATPVVLTGQSGAISIDADTHQDIDITATGNITLAAPTNAAKGKMIFLTLYATSALTITWNAAWVKNADSELPTAFVASKRMFLQFRCYDGTNWILLGTTKEA